MTLASRAGGSAAATSPLARAMSSSLVIATTSSAPLQTSDRCEAVAPKMRPLSNTHWNVLPGRPTNAVSVTDRSYQRLTVTIGEAAIRLALSARDVSSGTPCTVSGNENHGTDEITAPASTRWPRRSTPTARPPSTASVAGTPDCTDDPRASSHRRAGSAYRASSGTLGSPIAASDREPLNMRASTRAKGAAAAVAGDWFNAATTSGSHSSSRRRGVCPHATSHASAVWSPNRAHASSSVALRQPP